MRNKTQMTTRKRSYELVIILLISFISLFGIIFTAAWFQDKDELEESITLATVEVEDNFESFTEVEIPITLSRQEVLDHKVTFTPSSETSSLYVRCKVSYPMETGTAAKARDIQAYYDITPHSAANASDPNYGYTWVRQGEYYYFCTAAGVPAVLTKEEHTDSDATAFIFLDTDSILISPRMTSAAFGASENIKLVITIESVQSRNVSSSDDGEVTCIDDINQAFMSGTPEDLYTWTFKDASDNTISTVENLSYGEGIEYFEPEVEDNETFVEWNTEIDGSGAKVSANALSSIFESKTVYAIVRYNSVGIDVAYAGSGVITPNNGNNAKVYVDYGEDISFTVTPNAGYYISSLLINGVEQELSINPGQSYDYDFTGVTTTQSISAVFSIRYFDITSTTIKEGATLSENVKETSTASVAYGTRNYTINIVPPTGYEISELEVDGQSRAYEEEGTEVSFAIVTSDHEIVATFSRILYTITYYKYSGTEESGKSNPTSYYITSPTIELNPCLKNGYIFAGWYENSEFTGSKVSTIESGSHRNYTLYAKYITQNASDKTASYGYQIIPNFSYTMNGVTASLNDATTTKLAFTTSGSISPLSSQSIGGVSYTLVSFGNTNNIRVNIDTVQQSGVSLVFKNTIDEEYSLSNCSVIGSKDTWYYVDFDGAIKTITLSGSNDAYLNSIEMVTNTAHISNNNVSCIFTTTTLDSGLKYTYTWRGCSYTQGSQSVSGWYNGNNTSTDGDIQYVTATASGDIYCDIKIVDERNNNVSAPYTISWDVDIDRTIYPSMSNISGTYTGVAYTPTAQNVPLGATVTYTYTGTTASGTNVSGTGNNIIDAGTYVVTANVNGGTYWNNATCSCIVTISKANLVIDSSLQNVKVLPGSSFTNTVTSPTASVISGLMYSSSNSSVVVNSSTGVVSVSTENNVDRSITTISINGGNNFNNTSYTVTQEPYMFSDSTTLSKYLGNESIVTIPSEVTDVNVITGGIITSSTEDYDVEAIASGAITGITNIKELTLPASVEVIHTGGISNLYSIQKINLMGDLDAGYTLDQVRDGSWYKNGSDVSSLTTAGSYNNTGIIEGVDSEWEYSEISGVMTITAYLGTASSIKVPYKIYNTTTGEYDYVTAIQSIKPTNKAQIESVTISENITKISDNAFNGYTNLTRVTLPSTLTEIGNQAFYNCSAMTDTLNLATCLSLRSIGQEAFRNCGYGLRGAIDLSNLAQLRTIGQYAFGDASYLTSMSLPSGLTSMGDNIYVNDTNLTTINASGNFTVEGNVLFNSSKTKLYSYALKNTNSNYTIPSSVTSISTYAFYNEKDMQSVTFSGTEVNCGKLAFEGCDNLQKVKVPTGLGRYYAETALVGTASDHKGFIDYAMMYIGEDTAATYGYIRSTYTWEEVNNCEITVTINGTGSVKNNGVEVTSGGKVYGIPGLSQSFEITPNGYTYISSVTFDSVAKTFCEHSTLDNGESHTVVFSNLSNEAHSLVITFATRNVEVYDGVTATYFSDMASALSFASGKTVNMTLINTLTSSSNLTIPAGTTISYYSNQTLNLTNSSALIISSTSTFNMYSGNLSSNSTSLRNNGTLNVYGGTITTTATNVYSLVNSATANLLGGSVFGVECNSTATLEVNGAVVSQDRSLYSIYHNGSQLNIITAVASIRVAVGKVITQAADLSLNVITISSEGTIPDMGVKIVQPGTGVNLSLTNYQVPNASNCSLDYNTGDKCIYIHKLINLTADANGGTMTATTGWTLTSSSVATKTVSYGETYGTLPTPTRAGHTFLGWKNSSQLITTWEQGGIGDATGVNSDNMSNRVRTLYLLINSNTSYTLSVANSSYVIRGTHFYTQNLTWISYTTNSTYTTPANAKYVRIVVQRSDSTLSISPSEYSTFNLTLLQNDYVLSSNKIITYGDHSLTAMWQINTYTLTVNYVGDSSKISTATNLTITQASCSISSSSIAMSNSATVSHTYYTTPYTVTFGVSQASNSYKIKINDNTFTGSGDSGFNSETYSWTATENVTINVYIAQYFYIDLNGYLNGTSSGSLGDYGTASVTIGGTVQSASCNDYCMMWPYNTNYSVTVTANSGYKVCKTNSSTASEFVNSVSYSGTIPNTRLTIQPYLYNTYTIEFNSNGGSGTISSITNCLYHISYTLTANTMTRAGYTWSSWNTASDGTGDSYSDKASVSGLSSTKGGTATLYAQWSAITYTITINANGGTWSGTNPTYTISASSQTKTITPPTYSGRDLSSWTLSTAPTSGTPTAATNGTITIPAGTYGNFALTANWTAKTYTITYKANGGTDSDKTQSVTFNTNFTTQPSNAFSRTGYSFSKWSTASGSDAGSYTSANATYTYTTVGNTTLYARWTPNTYTVTLDKQSGSGGTNSVTATYDSAMPSATMPTRTGYTFGGYYSATNGGGTQYYTAAGASARTWNIDANSTLYAKWTANTYTVYYTDGANLLQNGDFQGVATNSSVGWDSSLNGTLVPSYGWGTGYNSGVSNPTTGYHSHIKDISSTDSAHGYVVENKRNQNRWLGMAQGISAGTITTGKYILSYDVYRVEGTHNPFAGLYYCLSGSTSYSFHSGDPVYSIKSTGTWERVAFVFNISSINASQSASVYIYGNSGGDGTFYYDNISFTRVTGTQTATYDTATAFANISARTGYTSNGWTIAYAPGGGLATSGLNTSTAKYGNNTTQASAISSSTTVVSGYYKNLTAVSGGAVVAVADYTIKTYTITTGKNYGTMTASTSSTYYSDTITLTAAYSNSGYNISLASVKVYAGTNTSGTCIATFTSATTSFRLSAYNTYNANIYVYATWNRSGKTYTITYTANGGTGSNVTQNVTYGNSFTTKPASTFSKTGYTLTSWSGGSYSSVNTSYTYSTAGNLTLSASWTAKTYYIYASPNASTTENLLAIDGSFESSSIGSWTNQATGSTVSASSAAAHGGSYSLCISGSTGGSNRIYLTAPGIEGYSYKISCYVKSTSSASLRYELNGGVYSWNAGYQSYSGTNSWQLLSLSTGTLETNCEIFVFLYTSTGATTYFDDVYCCKSDAYRSDIMQQQAVSYDSSYPYLNHQDTRTANRKFAGYFSTKSPSFTAQTTSVNNWLSDGAGTYRIGVGTSSGYSTSTFQNGYTVMFYVKYSGVLSSIDINDSDDLSGRCTDTYDNTDYYTTYGTILLSSLNYVNSYSFIDLDFTSEGYVYGFNVWLCKTTNVTYYDSNGDPYYDTWTKTSNLNLYALYCYIPTTIKLYCVTDLSGWNAWSVGSTSHISCFRFDGDYVYCNGTSGFENLYIPVTIPSGYTTKISFGYKIPEITAQYDSNVAAGNMRVQLLNTAPTSGSNINNGTEVACYQISSNTSGTGTITYSTAGTYYLSINFGFCNDGSELTYRFSNMTMESTRSISGNTTLPTISPRTNNYGYYYWDDDYDDTSYWSGGTYVNSPGYLSKTLYACYSTSQITRIAFYVSDMNYISSGSIYINNTLFKSGITAGSRYVYSSTLSRGSTLKMTATAQAATDDYYYGFTFWNSSDYNTAIEASSVTVTVTLKSDDIYGTISGYRQSTSTSCIAEGTMITLSDRTQKAVEDITLDDELLIFNHDTGELETGRINFIENDGRNNYDVINLKFSDGTITRDIYEHAYFDTTLNKYVYIHDYDCKNYIGHTFYSLSGNVTLVDAYVTTEYTGCYSLTTSYHLDYFTDGILSIPGGISGLFNIFKYDENLKYDEQDKLDAIEEFGLFTPEDFEGIIPEEVFNLYPTSYLKVALGRGLLTWEDIEYMIERYCDEEHLGQQNL